MKKVAFCFNALLFFYGICFHSTAWAVGQDLLVQVGVKQNIDQYLPLQTPFYDEDGKKIILNKYFSAKPVLLTFIYYNCPMLCSLNLRSLAQSLKILDLVPGIDYQLLVISFDPRDMGGNSREQLQRFLGLLGSSFSGIHFLTGTQASIDKITKAVGFQYAKNEENGQYAHTTALVVLTPDGRIVRYFFGLDYPPRDIKLALAQAQDKKPGSISRWVLLYCFQYHPQSGRYTLAVLNILKAAAFLTILVLGVLIYLLKKSEQKT